MSHALSALVPAALVRHTAVSDGAPVPCVQHGVGAVLFADISGFTALSERLAARDAAAGAEELSRLVNACFGVVVDTIEEFGGDVLRFAGDAPIALFSADGADGAAPDLPAAVGRATACAVALQERMTRARAREAIDVAIRVGIGAGHTVAMAVGGVERRCEFVVAGAALTASVTALALARGGDVVLARTAVAALAPRSGVHGDELVGGAWRVRSVAASSFSVLGGRPATAAQAAALRPFIPRSVLERVDAGQSDWVAELRRVTTLFVVVRGIDIADGSGCEAVHDAFVATQRAVYAAGGSVNQLVADDKGLVVVAAWGIPGATHEDDAARAMRAALETMQRHDELGVEASAGLATGRVFCGWRGAASRREFALFGRTISLAARLATCARSGVLCDTATRDAAIRQLEFEHARAVVVKGFETAVAAFRPIGQALPDWRRADQHALVGRSDELAHVQSLLRSARATTGSTLVLEGDAGMGKSAVLRGALELAAAANVTVLVGGGSSVNAAQPYHGWRAPVNELLKLPRTASPGDRVAALLAQSAQDPLIGDRAPLLADLLALPMSDTPLTAGLTDTLRFENTRDLVVALLQRETDRGPRLLVVDDAFWLDSASWGLVLAAHRRVTGLAIVIAARRFAEPSMPPELAEIRRGRRTVVCTLRELDDDEMAALASQLLGVSRLPSSLARLLSAKTGGHPLFVAELTRSLQEDGVVVVTDGVARLSRQAHELDLRRLPDTVQGVVASRVDKLTPAQQLTLKVASVLGITLSTPQLAAIHPMTRDSGALVDDLGALERAELLVRDGGEGGGRFAFRHSIVQEVAYERLVSQQRQDLHRAAAEWYQHAAIEPPPDALLAHHWTRAGHVPQALSALERAGTGAAAAGAARETIRFFQQALELAASADPPLERTRRARWLSMLGAAHLLDSAPERARDALDEALTLVGAPLPRSRGALSLRLAREIVRQLVHLLRPPPASLNRSGDERAVIEVEALASIGNETFFDQDQLGMLASLLAGINAAERTGNTAAMAGSYAAGGYVVALFRLERLANRWWQLAERTTQPQILSHAFVARAMHAVDVTRWADAEAHAARAIDVASRAGVHIEHAAALVTRMFAQSHQGQLDAVLATARDGLAVAVSAGLENRQVWFHHAIAACLLEKDAIDDAKRHIDQAIELMADITDPLTEATHLAHRLEFATVIGDREYGEVVAAHLLDRITRRPPAMSATFNIYYHLIEFLLDKWERVRLRGDATAEVEASAARVHQRLRAYARLFPIVRAAEARYHARMLMIKESPRRARTLLRRSIDTATQAGMPIAEALARVDLARLAPSPSAERLRQQRAARELLAAHGYARRLRGLDLSVAGDAAAPVA
jgi:class 3 adenylate cyclase/tetratricopeptide (TPR) repeat protein